MAGEGRGFWDRINPVPRVRAMVQNVAAHPIQTGGRVAANLAFLGAGEALQRGIFQPFNNWRDNRRGEQFHQDVGRPQIEGVNDRLQQDIWGGGQPRGGQQNPLVQALMGPSNYGGQQALNSGGYNVQQQWGQSQPQSILGAMPQGPSMGPDLSGLDAAIARANASGIGVKELGQFGGKGWGGVARGGAPGEMGVMGPGANGEAMIRGLMPMGRPVFNKRNLERG